MTLSQHDSPQDAPQRLRSAPVAGWYPTPDGSPTLTWWDGRHWSRVQGPIPMPTGAGSSYVAERALTSSCAAARKSVGVAFLLTFFFGPFGMLYSTVSGALVMMAASLVAFFLSFLLLGIPSLIAWVACILWGCSAASRHNARVALAHR